MSVIRAWSVRRSSVSVACQPCTCAHAPVSCHFTPTTGRVESSSIIVSSLSLSSSLVYSHGMGQGSHAEHAHNTPHTPRLLQHPHMALHGSHQCQGGFPTVFCLGWLPYHTHKEGVVWCVCWTSPGLATLRTRPHNTMPQTAFPACEHHKLPPHAAQHAGATAMNTNAALPVKGAVAGSPHHRAYRAPHPCT